MTVGMGQILVEPGELDANLQRALVAIGRASELGCQVVVLPEAFDVGWTFSHAAARAHPVPGIVTETLGVAARRLGIAIVAGLTERSSEAPGRAHNTAVLIDSQGQLRGTHRKINELAFARQIYAPGRILAPVDSDLGRVGLTVCADNWPDSLHLGASLAAMGARVILSPCAWAVPPDFDETATPYGGKWVSAYRHLARTHGMPVVGVSNVGPVRGGDWDGYSCIGRSLAVDADGTVIAQGPAFDEALLVVSLTVDLTGGVTAGNGDGAPAPR